MTFVTLATLVRVLAMTPGMFEALRRPSVDRRREERRALETLEVEIDQLVRLTARPVLTVEEYQLVRADAERIGRLATKAAFRVRNDDDSKVLKALGDALSMIVLDGAWWRMAAKDAVLFALDLRSCYPHVHNPVASVLEGLQISTVGTTELEAAVRWHTPRVQGWEEQEMYTAWGLRLVSPAVSRAVVQVLAESEHGVDHGLVALDTLCARFEMFEGSPPIDAACRFVATETQDRVSLFLERSGDRRLSVEWLRDSMLHLGRIAMQAGDSEYARSMRRRELHALAAQLRGSPNASDPLCSIVSTRNWQELEPPLLVNLARSAQRLNAAGR